MALDFAQCFDALNVDICTNDIYEVGVRSSELNLLYNSDQRSCIAIKTPSGLTKRQDVLMTIAQGEVFSPLKCCVTVDSMSKEHASKQIDNLYTYKGSVEVPALGMVDDQLLIMECGTSSVKTNSFINAQANIKRLQYGATKCYKLHCGKSSVACPDLKVDTWKLVNPSTSPSSILELVDQEGDPHTLETVPYTKYLGDFSSADGKNDKNILERFNKGNGKVSEIFFLLEDLCLGKYFFESGNILRNSLLLSSLLSNSESWYNVTPKQVDMLERVDEYYLRQHPLSLRADGEEAQLPLLHAAAGQ